VITEQRFNVGASGIANVTRCSHSKVERRRPALQSACAENAPADRPGIRTMSATVLLVVAATVAATAAPAIAKPSIAACGTERWSVKTLMDHPSLLPPQATTVHYLVTRPAPASLPPTRLPFELHVYTVTAAVTYMHSEADGDIHIVLTSGADHMIAEAPNPGCTAGASAVRRSQMSAARSQIRLCAKAQVAGVAFFDFKHGQHGVAPNAIELHPILAFHCLSG
jgi:hypothetical protein